MAATSGEPGPQPPGAWGPIPDDASSLEPDRLAWLAEERAARRALRRRRRRASGLRAPLLAFSLAVAAALCGLAVTVVPSGAGRPRPVPLAAVAVARAGTPVPAVESPGGTVVGRRLPDVTLEGDAGLMSSAALRPAVLALVPAGCACAPVVDAVSREAAEFRIDLWLVGGPGSAPLLTRLDTDGARGGARWAVDPGGGLLAALGESGLTVALVGADGVIADLGRDLPLDPTELPPLEPLLARLPSPDR